MNRDMRDPNCILSNVRASPWKDNGLTDEQKIAKITENFREIMETLGMDLTDDSLKESPSRVAKMYVTELFRGMKPENFPKMTVIENKMLYDQMVVVRDVKVISLC
ncbi:MAG: GTP cyclohydrolase I, partial [Bdellovibrionota bacterium]